jgi:hypothetical protein
VAPATQIERDTHAWLRKWLKGLSQMHRQQEGGLTPSDPQSDERVAKELDALADVGRSCYLLAEDAERAVREPPAPG